MCYDLHENKPNIRLTCPFSLVHKHFRKRYEFHGSEFEVATFEFSHVKQSWQH